MRGRQRAAFLIGGGLLYFFNHFPYLRLCSISWPLESNFNFYDNTTVINIKRLSCTPVQFLGPNLGCTANQSDATISQSVYRKHPIPKTRSTGQDLIDSESASSK